MIQTSGFGGTKLAAMVPSILSCLSWSPGPFHFKFRVIILYTFIRSFIYSLSVLAVTSHCCLVGGIKSCLTVILSQKNPHGPSIAHHLSPSFLFTYTNITVGGPKNIYGFRYRKYGIPKSMDYMKKSIMSYRFSTNQDARS